MPMLAQEDDLSASTLIRRYVNGPQGALSMTTGGGTYYLHRDPLGSITDLTNSTGIAQWNWDYEPYGSTLSQLKLDPSAPDVTLGYTGQYQDPETSTYQLRARQYDPATGRFDELDPVAAPPSDPHTSAYVYTAGRPSVLIDPRGEDLSFPTFCLINCNDGSPVPVHAATGEVAQGGLEELENQVRGTISIAVRDFKNGCAFEPLRPDCVRQAASDLAGAGQALASRSSSCVHGDLRDCGAVLVDGVEVLALHRVCAARATLATTEGIGETLASSDLTADQLSKYAGFTKKLPSAAKDPTITKGPNGTVNYSAIVPGRVPGSYAVYRKVVDVTGRTIGYTKTVIDPEGNVISVKDKMVAP